MSVQMYLFIELNWRVLGYFNAKITQMLKSQGYRARSAICDIEAAQITVVTQGLLSFLSLILFGFSCWLFFFILSFLLSFQLKTSTCNTPDKTHL